MVYRPNPKLFDTAWNNPQNWDIDLNTRNNKSNYPGKFPGDMALFPDKAKAHSNYVVVNTNTVGKSYLDLGLIKIDGKSDITIEMDYSVKVQVFYQDAGTFFFPAKAAKTLTIISGVMNGGGMRGEGNLFSGSVVNDGIPVTDSLTIGSKVSTPYFTDGVLFSNFGQVIWNGSVAVGKNAKIWNSKVFDDYSSGTMGPYKDKSGQNQIGEFTNFRNGLYIKGQGKSFIDIEFTNLKGTVDVQRGILVFRQTGFSAGGIYRVDKDEEIQYLARKYPKLGSPLPWDYVFDDTQFSGKGLVTLDDSRFDLRPPENAQGYSISVENFRFARGLIRRKGGILLVKKSLIWLSGTMGGPSATDAGGMTILSSGASAKIGGGAPILYGWTFMNMTATVALKGGDLEMKNGSAFYNIGGVFDIQDDSGIKGDSKSIFWEDVPPIVEG